MKHKACDFSEKKLCRSMEKKLTKVLKEDCDQLDCSVCVEILQDLTQALNKEE